MTNPSLDSILIGGIEKRPIVIDDYNPSWPSQYQKHAAVISGALGAAVLRLEHIGSTSVPGLAAKPIIDILVVVPNSADESSYLPHLEAAGYTLRVREPAFYEHRMFRTPSRNVHIHIYSPGSPEIHRNLLFRDHLRAYPADCRQYELLKRQLATRDWADINHYANAKTEFIESIITRARARDISTGADP